MEGFVTDTMALILYLEKRKMPENVKQVFQQVVPGKTRLFIPSMVIAEIGYLSEKGKIELTLKEVEKFISVNSFVEVHAQTLEVILTSFEIIDIPELHDRIIAGTAKYLDLVLLTNDPKIEASSSVTTVWK